MISFLSLFFILLIFFSIGTHFVQVQGFSLELPKAPAGLQSAPKGLIVTIDKNKNIYFGDTKIQEGNNDILKSRISDARKKNKNELLFVRTDGNTAMNELAEIVAIARELDMGVFIVTSSAGKTHKKAQFIDSQEQ